MLGAHVVVLITAPSGDEAEKIARKLVEEKLAACVNIVTGIRSFFWWMGRMEEAGEILVIAKSRLDILPKLIEAVKRMHSYTVPEIIAMPIIAGISSYLKWIDETIGNPGDGDA